MEKNRAKQKHIISCPYGQLIYIMIVIGSKANLFYSKKGITCYSECNKQIKYQDNNSNNIRCCSESFVFIRFI
ncbi:hypothetical protein Bmyc01_61430 [Bacillus mycoides]|nr:hypothetical protein Bmyc01_61430 [Bacillus mycoides]